MEVELLKEAIKLLETIQSICAITMGLVIGSIIYFAFLKRTK